MSDVASVLIVDDEPNVRLMFRTALQSAGHETGEAGDGEAALARLRDMAPDLVLLDLRMPGMDGLETLRRMREADDDTAVVIVTAHGSIPDAVAAMKLGAIDFLTKPVTPEDLRQVVAEVVSRHRRLEPGEEPMPAPAGARRPGPTVVEIARPALDLGPAKRALNLQQFDRAATLLEAALDRAPDSAEALTLMGVLHESHGQDHAAYHSYKAALAADPQFGPARDNLRRYCERFGLDWRNKAINPSTD
jgi:DNA-binding response OmpR family regulator